LLLTGATAESSRPGTAVKLVSMRAGGASFRHPHTSAMMPSDTASRRLRAV
jgi:hypothetical protein